MDIKINQRSGFTLLELIIVIIIIGVLASIALPKLFRQVEFSRASEALNILGIARRNIEACALLNNSVANCDTFSAIGMDDPASEPGAHFRYKLSVSEPNSYKITAVRNTFNGGDGKSTIGLNVDGDVNTISKEGTGVFSQIH